ncbi:MAG: phosphoribosylformylglycinamidine synthase I [Candidatus Omnitrophica bacterium]|nr:phosphoribosylformylglycinamidine synthase I [Candidatus Omnitrophota bacterium]
MAKPKVIVLRAAGTNCDAETAFAFETVGAKVELVHINRLISKEKKINDYRILAIPGGFTYGDDIASGKILANEIKYKLKEDLRKFISDGKIIIGICNGFQVLVKSGLLPDINENFESIEATLSLNDSAKFEDRWVYLRDTRYATRDTKCIWTKGVEEIIYLPVAHAEGKFIPKNEGILKKLKENNQIVFTYCDEEGQSGGYPCNPNGSIGDIAGICDITGRVFGLMPHPERHIHYTQHPYWTRIPKKNEGDGLKIFSNGVEFMRNI